MPDYDSSPDAQPAPPPHSSGLRLNDVLFILFRYKWLILGSAALGIVASAVLFLTHKPVYQSDAKLLVRYVVESSSIDTASGDRRITNPDARGEGTMAAQVEILTSWDLANEVARALNATETSNRNRPQTTNATPDDTLITPRSIVSGLTASIPRRGNTIVVSYRGKDPELVVKTLNEIVNRYLEKHLQVYRAANAYDLLSRQADTLKNRLAETEEQLRKLKTQANVVSLVENKAALNNQSQRLRESLFTAQADYAEQEARIREIQRSLGNLPTTPGTTNAAVVPVEIAVQDRYREMNTRLAVLRLSQNQLLSQFTDKHPLVEHLTGQITQLETEKARLETDHPGLIAIAPRDITPAPGTPAGTQPIDLISEYANLAAINARLSSLTNQHAEVQTSLAAITKVESEVIKLERSKMLDETNYIYYSSALERARLDETLDPTRMPNISIIQKPSMPLIDGKARLKRAGIPLAAGLAFGLGIAFLLEMFIDQRVKKASEIEHRLGVPLILTIPEVKGLAKVDLNFPDADDSAKPAPDSPVPILPSLLTAGTAARDAGHPSSELRASSSEQNGSPSSELRAPSSESTALSPLPSPLSSGAGAIPSLAPWNTAHSLRPYFEALRDRLMLYFQLNKMLHKPKLVAVTSCTEGAGASTLAAGLAAALSETGDGNVLLVDMNLGKGAVHPFFRGKPASSLADVLEPERRIAGQVQDNLYLAAVNDGADAKRHLPLPKRFHTLMPKMRASDYDYIIFDMPPMSETSATVALSASMDQVLLVIENEKTHRSDVKRAYEMLHRYNANVTGVFNKQRALGPKWLLAEG